MTSTTLSSRISFIITPIILIFCLIAVVITNLYLSNQFKNSKIEYIKSDLFQSSLTLEESIAQSTRLVSSIAKNPLSIEILQTASPSAKQRDMVDKALNNLNLGNIYSSIYIINTSGITVSSTDKTFVNQDYSFRAYFKKAIAGENYFDVNYGVTSHMLGYYFSAVVKNQNNKIIGVTVAKMSSGYFDSLLQKVSTNPMMDLMVTDRFGVIISSLKKDRILSSLGKLPEFSYQAITDQKIFGDQSITPLQYQSVQDLISSSTAGIHAVSFTDDVDKTEELLTVSPINNSPLWIVSETDMSKVFAQSKSVGQTTAIIVTTCALAAVFVIYFFIFQIVNPIKKATQMAVEISGGNFNQVNQISTHDEIEELGKAIETMAISIKNKYQNLEETLAQQTKFITQKSQNVENNNLALTNLLEDLENSKNDLEKFKLAVENASDHIVITDADGVILYANLAVTNITGFSREEVISKKAGSKDLWGGQMTKNFYEKLWKTIKTDKKVFSGQLNNHRKNGEKYIAFAHISPIFNSDGKVVYFVAIERDVTHEIEVDRMKTDFISLASHQLRTPLSAMRWFSEMLLDGDAGKLTKEQTEYVTNIAVSNERMTSLVNSLLNISRIESGRIIIDPEPTDLNILIKEVLVEIDNKIKEKKQTVVVSVHQGLGKIKIDPKLIREVYKNLLTNANKYTDVGGEISVFVSKKGGDIISQVSDNGFGIPEKNQSKIFERFYRAENIIKLETEGTGLGLYLAKAIVESSGGKIWFKSQEGSGTSFWFTLPIAGVKAKKGEVSLNS